eukprot:228143-Chlamydomonas_euryale.AAC.4
MPSGVKGWQAGSGQRIALLRFETALDCVAEIWPPSIRYLPPPDAAFTLSAPAPGGNITRLPSRRLPDPPAAAAGRQQHQQQAGAAAGAAEGSSSNTQQQPAVSQVTLANPQPPTVAPPQLLRPGELAVGVAAEEFAARRRRLSALMLPGSIAVLPAATVTYMAGIVPYPYRPDPDFLYLTGLAQRGVVALEASRATSAGAGSAGCVEPRMVVFLEAPDPDADRWDGVRIDKACAAELLGAHQKERKPGGWLGVVPGATRFGASRLRCAECMKSFYMGTRLDFADVAGRGGAAEALAESSANRA